MNGELPHDKQREWAKLLYTKHDYSQKEIALMVGVDEAALRFWITDGRWEGAKRSLLTARAAQLGNYYYMLEQLQNKKKEPEKEGTMKDAELIVKYTNAIKNLEEESFMSEAIQIGEKFTTWLMHRDLALAQKVTGLYDLFIKDHLA